MAKFPNCQHVKAEHLKPGGLTQIIKVLTLKWKAINIDFVVGLLKSTRQHDSTWVILDRLTKSANFIPVKSTYRAEDYARLFIDEIVRLYGITFCVISHRGAQFTSLV